MKTILMLSRNLQNKQNNTLIKRLIPKLEKNIYDFSPIIMNYINLSYDSSIDKRDHLAITSNQQREKDIHDVIVTELYDISPTVKKVTLTTIKPVPFSFKAGQWLDLFIPNEKQVGGFSMVSTPTYLKKTGHLELAVKYSEWPPAFWIHTKCRVGSELSIRIGGDFFFDTEDLNRLNNKIVLFIAGGVGINPLASMIFHLDELKQEFSHLKLQTILLFSAKSESELLFHEKLEKIAEKDESFKLRFFITKEEETYLQPLNTRKFCTVRRINKSDILEALRNSGGEANGENLQNTLVYICGPPPLITEVEEILQSIGISKIFYETWWS